MMRPRLRTVLFAGLIVATGAPGAYLGLAQVARWREVQRRDADKELTFAADALSREVARAIESGALEDHNPHLSRTVPRL